MDANATSWFEMASRRMEWLSARQKVIAENMANADTPGFVGRDVQSFESFLKDEDRGSDRVRLQEAGSAWGGSMDGNRVVLEEQTILSAQAAGDFRLATRLYAKGFALISLATGKR